VVVDAGAESGSGSGFVLRDDGYVVTNNHVIDAAVINDGTVEIVLNDGRRLEAEIVGRNVSYDVAVLRVADASLQPLTAGEAPAAVGDSVLVIGAPLGYDFTVTTGIVSAVDRPVTVGEADEASYISAIQTDAPINPGNSGGPVLDGQGSFIGMASSMATLARAPGVGSIGLGFAIPARAVVRIAEEIIATGSSRTPIMGVTLDTTFPGPGALIDTVTPEGPAETAGLRPGDVVTAINGQRVDSAQALRNAEGLLPVNEAAALDVRRGAQALKLSATLREQPKQLPGADIDARLAGATLGELAEKFRRGGLAGVAVTDVAAGSRAGQNGLMPGDRIYGVNGRRVDDLPALRSALAQPPARLILRVQRGAQQCDLELR